MKTEYILTTFMPHNDHYTCPCGAFIDTYDGWDAYNWFSKRAYCPECGERRVDYVTEDQAFGLNTYWLSRLDWGKYTLSDGTLDYLYLWGEYMLSSEKWLSRVITRSMYDFKGIIDRAYSQVDEE